MAIRTEFNLILVIFASSIIVCVYVSGIHACLVIFIFQVLFMNSLIFS